MDRVEIRRIVLACLNCNPVLPGDRENFLICLMITRRSRLSVLSDLVSVIRDTSIARQAI